MEKFNYEPNGYNRKEVNQFISDVIDQTSGIVKKYTEQKEKIKQYGRYFFSHSVPSLKSEI